MTIKFKLGFETLKEQPIEMNLEDYLVKSSDLGIGGDPKCYLPIFV